MRLSTLRTALEGLEVEQPQGTEEDQAEQRIVQLHAAQMDQLVEQDTFNQSLDGLGTTIGATTDLVEAGGGTSETLALLSMMAEPYQLLVKRPRIAVENFHGTMRENHVAALESFRSDWQNLLQDAVVSFKQSKDFWTDLFKNTNEQVAKYENILSEAETEFREKSSSHDEQYHHGSMHQIWYHFSTDRGQAVNLLTTMEKDHDVAEYILTAYPAKLTALIKTAMSTISSGSLNDAKSIAAFGKALGKLQHPADVFDKKYIGGKPYFHVMGLETVTKTPRKPIAIDGQSLDELAELATTRFIEEDSSTWHITKKIGAQTLPGAYIAALVVKELTLTDAEVGKLIDFGKRYLKNIKKFAGLESQVLQAAENLETAVDRMVSKSKDLTGREEQAALQVIMQAEAYVKNILTCLHSPATQEISRSLKSARYCGYLAKRMNWNSR